MNFSRFYDTHLFQINSLILLLITVRSTYEELSLKFSSILL